MSDVVVLERRRDALKTAARLQRRNLGIRWRTLRGKRAVQWVESGLAATRALRDSSGALIAPSGRSGGWVWLAGALRLFAGTRGGFFGTALRALRRPSLWSLAMLVGQWWWRRRRRQRRPAVRARAIGTSRWAHRRHAHA